MDVPLSVENWLSLGTHSFLCGLGSVFAYWWTRRVLMFVLSSWDSAFRFDFACTFALLIAQFTGLIPFWIFFRVLIYETFGLIPFGLTYLCEVSFEIISRFSKSFWCHLFCFCRNFKAIYLVIHCFVFQIPGRGDCLLCICFFDIRFWDEPL
jgi:hypothetical protein